MEQDIQLQMSDEVRNLLEERSIGERDIRLVLAYAEEGRRFHTHAATGRRLAYVAPAKVTYWVEYEPTEGGYRILGAYSHRMKILHGYNLPSKKEHVDTGWVCSACELPLVTATVKLAYMDETFAVDLPSCPACQRIFVSEEQAVVKMATAERMLEDK